MNREDLIYPIPLKLKPLPAVVKIPAFLTPEHCRRLISRAEEKGLASLVQDRFGLATNTASCRLMPEDDKLIYELFALRAAELNEEVWRLALSGIYEPLNLLRYRVGDWIRPHVDGDYRLPDPSKLSCVIQLVPSDSFTGGVLTIAESERVQLDIGDAVFFPSNMIHTVSPIESGERFVLAGWVHGSPFR